MPFRHSTYIMVAIAAPLAATLLPAQRMLPATPSTVAWGYYSAKAKPVLTVNTGDSVIIQTLSTCGPAERIESLGVKASDIPDYVRKIYADVPAADRGPGGHILTGP